MEHELLNNTDVSFSIIDRAEHMLQNRERLAFYQTPLSELASSITASIISDGRLLLNSCPRYHFAAEMLSQLMRKNSRIDRPQLPVVMLDDEQLNYESLETHTKPQDYLLLLWSDADISPDSAKVVRTLEQQQLNYTCMGRKLASPACKINLLIKFHEINLLVLLLTTLTLMLESRVLGLYQN